MKLWFPKIFKEPLLPSITWWLLLLVIFIYKVWKARAPFINIYQSIKKYIACDYLGRFYCYIRANCFVDIYFHVLEKLVRSQVNLFPILGNYLTPTTSDKEFPSARSKSTVWPMVSSKAYVSIPRYLYTKIERNLRWCRWLCCPEGQIWW